MIQVLRTQIELTPEQRRKASQIGLDRHNMNLDTWYRDRGRYGVPDDGDWQVQIEGALGEYAVALCLGLDWDGAIGNYAASDVGPFQVRTTRYSTGHLLLHHADTGRFILVTGLNGRYRLRGWMDAEEGKRVGWYGPFKTGKPNTWSVAQEKLHSMETFS